MPRKKPLRCIIPDCNGSLARLNVHNGLGYEIMYFKCRKCKDLTYLYMNGPGSNIGDAYHRGSFDLSHYQVFLRSVDMDLIHGKEKERELKHKVEQLESRVGWKGVWKDLKGLLRRKK